MNARSTALMASLAIGLTVCCGCANKEKERQAILDALRYDQSISDKTHSSLSLGEWFLGASEERKANYVRNLRRVPLDDCPEDFAYAYQRHIDAWERRDTKQITATWMDVLAIARLHGVDWK